MPTPDADLADWLRTRQAALLRYARWLGARDRAEDLVQDAFVLALRRNLQVGDDPVSRAQAARWLRAAVFNLQRENRRRLRREADGLFAAAERAWSNAAGPDEGETKISSLRACIEALPPRSLRALRLCYAERASREDIGHALGLRPDGIKTMLRRVRAQLRACVERRQQEDQT